MASTPFYDAPGGIRRDGNNQTLIFKRLTPTTGSVCWSPVPPSQNCGSLPGVYAGGVLVGSTSPISQINKPKDGVCCYTADPSMDELEFAGDKISNAYVLWSNNNDTTTSCITVTGLNPSCTAYFFAFFAEDNTCRYNQDGIYSYSLELTGPDIPCVSGSQLITTNAAHLTDPLPSTADLTINYPTTLIVDGEKHELTIRGAQLTTYQSVVDELNTAWKREAPFATSEFPPFYGDFLVQGSRWFQHDGVKYNEIFPIISSTDPTVIADGELWYDTSTRDLKEYLSGVWNVVSVLSMAQDPTIGTTSLYWYDGTVARQFNGTVWLQLPTYVSIVDPTLPPAIDATNLWHKTDQEFYKWSPTRNKWLPIVVLTAALLPESIPEGTNWLNTTATTLWTWRNLAWEQVTITISETQPTPSSNVTWLNPTTRIIKWYDVAQMQWITVPYVSFHKALDQSTAGDLHYNPANHTMRMYDELTDVWIDITPKLITSATDPSLAPIVIEGSLWRNPSVGMWSVYGGGVWTGVDVVGYPSNPLTMTSGYWYNTNTQLWYERNGNVWNPITPTISPTDPRTPILGTTWFDGTLFRQRTTINSWSSRTVQTTPGVNIVGSRWENTQGVLHSWSGASWDAIKPPYIVSTTKENNILITSTGCGSQSFVDISGAAILNALKFTACIPTMGNDGMSGTHMTTTVGIGTDGSVDERRAIIDNLYARLGAPTINVELTRDKMDLAVQRGLDYLRRDSGAGYSRGYFFLDLLPGQQHYVLTSKAVGFNTIVDVLRLHRPRAGLFNSTYAGDAYGQQLLQQLYVAGTFDILSYHLMASYQTVVSKLFVAEMMFDWKERTRTLRLMRRVARHERVLVDAVVEKTEQELLTDRNTKNWIEEWALAEAKMMLGEIRGKFASLPGAGGSVTMNAESLKVESIALKEKLTKELDDFIASDVGAWGLGSSIVKG